jgi:hypothetical protein
MFLSKKSIQGFLGSCQRASAAILRLDSWRAFIAGKRGACRRKKRLALVRRTAKPLAFFHGGTRAFSYNAP